MSELPSSIWRRIAEDRAAKIEELEATNRDMRDRLTCRAARIGELEVTLREIRDAPVGALRTETVREIARRALDGKR